MLKLTFSNQYSSACSSILRDFSSSPQIALELSIRRSNLASISLSNTMISQKRSAATSGAPSSFAPRLIFGPRGWITLFWINFLRPELNGSQIKKIVRTAQALATSDGEQIGPKQIEMAWTAMKMFENDFDEDLPENGSGVVRAARSKRQRIEDSWESD
jgi:hypothetical protein